MINPIKHIINKFCTVWPTKIFFIFFRNILFIFRFKKRLNADTRNKSTIILIHQMGKVGSSTVESSLREFNLRTPIYKTHYLNEDTVKTMWNDKVKLHKKPLKKHYLANKYISRMLTNPEFRENKLNIITLVREPVICNISRFFHSIEDFIPNFYKNIEKGVIQNDEIIDVFINVFPYHSWNLEWFDKEVKNVFGIDVYSKPFDKLEGFQIFNEKNVDLLLLKLESLNNCSRKAFRQYLGINNFAIVNSNVAKDKPYEKPYREFIKSIEFPKSYLDKMYCHKYTQHFYSESEIAEFRNRWSKNRLNTI